MRVLASAGTPIALVLVTGRPRLLHGVEALPQVKRERRARGERERLEAVYLTVIYLLS